MSVFKLISLQSNTQKPPFKSTVKPILKYQIDIWIEFLIRILNCIFADLAKLFFKTCQVHRNGEIKCLIHPYGS